MTDTPHSPRPVQRRGAARPRALALLLPAATLLVGCRGPQSMLEPHGDYAEWVWQLTLVLTVVCALVLVAVTTMAMLAIFRAPERRPRLAPMPFVIGAGLVFTPLVLIALLVYSTIIGNRIVREPAEPPLQVHVRGQQFWWHVSYPDAPRPVTTANELVLPVGRPVQISIDTDDVIHSFWIPNLAGKTDLIPGRTNSVRFTPTSVGRFRGQCAEFCGLLHAHMSFSVQVVEEAEFEAWQARRLRAVDETAVGDHADALEVFVARGCVDCHAIRGATANGEHGPDLTHFGDRVRRGERTTPAGRPQLAVWLAQRHPRELERRFGQTQAPSLDEAEQLMRMLEALE